MKFIINRLGPLLLLTLISLNSCGNMQNQVHQIVEHNKKQVITEAEKLQAEKVLTQAECEKIKSRLVQDLDYYLNHQDIGEAGITALFKETVGSFQQIKITRQVFTVITTAYYCIASQRMMHHYPPTIEMEIQQQVNKAMNDWFEKYQTNDDRFDDLIFQVANYKKQSALKSITGMEYDAILQTLTTIRKDSMLAKDTVKAMLIEDMRKYCNRDNIVNLELLNIYNTVNQLRQLGIEQELKAIYDANFVPPTPPTYNALKSQVNSRLKWMLSEELITDKDYILFRNTIIADINFCEQAKEKSKLAIKTKLTKSLATLSSQALETEDREAVSEWYFELSKKMEVDIKDELNHWLYPFLEK